MRKIQILDLDGCLADDAWRRELIGPEPERGRADPAWLTRFDLYHESSIYDKPANAQELISDAEYVIFTGRPVRYKEITRQWLLRSLSIKPTHILMRNNDDFRQSHMLKSAQMDWLLKADYEVLHEDIVEAIDDMEAVVRMYREKWKIPARIVRIGEKEHVHG